MIYSIADMNVKKVFGSNLRTYRKKAGVSLEKMAELLDISAKHLGAIETGKSFVSAELLESISETLGVSVSALFYSAEEKSLDESTVGTIDKIIATELEKISSSIRVQIHQLTGKNS